MEVNIMEISEKYINAVHYIINICENPSMLGSIKLNKILLFTDGIFYRKNEQTLTGDVYVKRQFGPVPKNILNVLGELVARNKISIRKDTNTHLFFSLEEPDISKFSPYEIDTLSSITHDISHNYTSRKISDITHTLDWEIVPIGCEIDLYDYFVAQEEELTEEDICVLKTLI